MGRLHEAEENIAKLNELRLKISEVESSVEKKENAPPVPVELPLPHDVCLEIAKHESEALAFASSCKGFKDAMKEVLRSRKNTVYHTDVGRRREVLVRKKREQHYREKGVPVSEQWI